MFVHTHQEASEVSIRIVTSDSRPPQVAVEFVAGVLPVVSAYLSLYEAEQLLRGVETALELVHQETKDVPF